MDCGIPDISKNEAIKHFCAFLDRHEVRYRVEYDRVRVIFSDGTYIRVSDLDKAEWYVRDTGWTDSMYCVDVIDEILRRHKLEEDNGKDKK